MQYEKCPRCELNYKRTDEEYCPLCRAFLEGRDEEEEEELPLCPLCLKNPIGYDEVICKKCQKKRSGQ